jgi:hypothetical protein
MGERLDAVMDRINRKEKGFGIFDLEWTPYRVARHAGETFEEYQKERDAVYDLEIKLTLAHWAARRSRDQEAIDEIEPLLAAHYDRWPEYFTGC